MIETKPLYASSLNLADVNHNERINLIDFGGQSSRSQRTYIEISLWAQSSSNLADMLTMARGWTLLILEVKGEGHDGNHSQDFLMVYKIWTRIVFD